MSSMAYILGHQKFFQRLDDDRWDVGIVTLIVLGRKGPHGFPFRRPHSQFPIH